MQAKSQSSTLKNQKLAHWNFFKKGIEYRGTYSDLRAESLQIKLYNNSLFSKTKLGQRTVALRDVVTS